MAQKSFFVLRGKRFSEERFRRYLRELPTAAGERQSELLSLMRDEGVSNPTRALELLRDVEADGALGEELGVTRVELEWARDLPHSR